jgi:FlgN protein
MTDSARDRSRWAQAPTRVAEAFAAFTSMLWRERECVEVLLFKLVEQQLILSSGHTRWLHFADDEVRAAAEALREAELIRAAELDLLAQQLGLSADTTLNELADVAPEPWDSVLRDHGEALRSLVLQVRASAVENKRLLQAGEQAIRETVDQLRGGRAGYDAHGVSAGLSSSAYLLDEQA